MRMMKTLSTSNMGPIRMAMAMAGAEVNFAGKEILAILASINLIAMIDVTRPISIEPASPIKILAGDILNNKKPKLAPVTVKARHA